MKSHIEYIETFLGDIGTCFERYKRVEDIEEIKGHMIRVVGKTRDHEFADVWHVKIDLETGLSVRFNIELVLEGEEFERVVEEKFCDFDKDTRPTDIVRTLMQRIRRHI